MYLLHPGVQHRPQLRYPPAHDVDPAVGARENHLGVLKRVDTARLVKESRILLQKGEMCVHFTTSEDVGAEDGVRDLEVVPEEGDEVHRAGDVGDDLAALCRW